MYLAEAIKEKEFISESIIIERNRIVNLSVSTDVSDIKLNKELIKSKIKDLENLYKDFQKYSIIISRAKVLAKINLNDEEFSIADAENILEAVRAKLNYFERLISEVDIVNLDPQTFNCIDLDELYTKINNIRADIRTISNNIERSLWSIEV